MSTPDRLGGIIHTYQKYDPMEFPSPTAPPPDMVSAAFEHMLAYGDMRQLSEEELAKMVKIDPTAIKTAAAFLKNFHSDVDDAINMIGLVGSFIDEVGGSGEAIAALNTVKELQASMA